MLPIVMDNNFIKLAVIDDYISFIWTSRFYSSGDFELCVDVNAKNMTLFKQGYYIVRNDDENVGIIENITIQHNEDSQEILIITGRFLQSILGRRIIVPQTTVTGKVSACIESLITSNIVNPSVVARKISNFIIDSTNIDITMNAQFTGDNLLEVVSTLCETYGIGFKITLNANNQFVFKLYQGEDRTYDQTENPWVVFSDEYDNLASSNYEENYQDIATAVWVAGEGEGLARKNVWVTTEETGLERHEFYEDARSIQSNNGEISDTEYMKLLQEAGKEDLTKYTTAFMGNVYFDNIKYKEDVSLGDICVIENKRWGLSINSRLVEVIESVSEAGEYSIVPTFGL